MTFFPLLSSLVCTELSPAAVTSASGAALDRDESPSRADSAKYSTQHKVLFLKTMCCFPSSRAADTVG